jgi:hypothetical protein
VFQKSSGRVGAFTTVWRRPNFSGAPQIVGLAEALQRDKRDQSEIIG